MKADRISLLLIGSIVLTALSALITHLAIENSRIRVEKVFHTYKILGLVSSLMSDLKDLKIQQRAFLETADSMHLVRYSEALQRIPGILDSLDQLVDSSVEQTQFLRSTIKPIIYTKLKEEKEHAGDSVKSRNHHYISFLDALSKPLMQFTQFEEEQLEHQLSKIDEAHRFHNIFRFVSFVLISATSMIALITIRKKQRENDQLVTQLQEVNQMLDKKVKERTRELQKKNERANELNRKLEESLKEVQTFYDALQITHEKTTDTFNEVRDLYNNAPCGYHSLDAAGTIVRINNRELSWLGYEREEVVGKLNIRDVLIPDEVKDFDQKFPEFLKKGVAQNREHHFRRKDGTTFPVLVNATAVYDSKGRYIMSRGVVIDTTFIKEIENKLIEANKKLVKLNEDKDHILAIAAHDLKSPLNGIIGLINLMKPDSSNLTTDQREYLNYINQSCINMSTLVNNLLDISRIEKGNHRTTWESVDLHGVLKQQVQMFKDEADRKGITIRIEGNTASYDLVTDRNSLMRILENLISNAIKFSPHNTEVFVQASVSNGRVRLTVKDQGPGIAREDLPKLFTKYQLLTARPTGGETSTGLGLSIVKELVRCLNGHIMVESIEHEGTSFIIELPLKPFDDEVLK